MQSLFRHLVLNYGAIILRSNSCLVNLESQLGIQTEILTPDRTSVTWQWYFMQQDLNKTMK